MFRQFNVLVKIGSKHGPLVEVDGDGSMTVHVSESTLEGKTNLKLIEMVARHYDVPKSKVKIVKGISSKNKIIRIN